MAEHESTITVRLPKALLRRVATLTKRETAQRIPELSLLGRPSRSMVIRLAITRGLDQLELELTPAPARPKKATRPAPKAPAADPAPAPKARPKQTGPKTRRAADGVDVQVELDPEIAAYLEQEGVEPKKPE